MSLTTLSGPTVGLGRLRRDSAIASRRALAGPVALVLVFATMVAACGGGPAALALGTEATVKHAEVVGDGFGPVGTLGITVVAVRRGTIDELTSGGFTVEDDQRSLTPWYVDQRFRNAGDQPISRELRVSLEDGSGDLITAVTIFDYAGTEFAACPDRTEGTLAPGEAFDTCTLFFADPGKGPALARFLPIEPGRETDWVSWKATP